MAVFGTSPPPLQAMDDEGLHPQDNEQHSYVLVTGANR